MDMKETMYLRENMESVRIMEQRSDLETANVADGQKVIVDGYLESLQKSQLEKSQFTNLSLPNIYK